MITNEEYRITYSSRQILAPELPVKSSTYKEFTVKKDMRDWARFFAGGTEAARWNMQPDSTF